MATLNEILTLAKHELGYQESPADSNRTKFGKWYGLDGNPWCMMFVMWVFHQADASSLLPVRTASCAEFMKAAKKVKNWHTGALKSGDIVIFDFPGNASKAEHVGIVDEIADENHAFTIEGNTGVGNDANGGMVMRRKRKRSLIAGAFRPAYDTESASETQAAGQASETHSYDYGERHTVDETSKKVHDSGVATGDLASFVGTSQFSGPYDDAEPLPAQSCMAKVGEYKPGRAHPFHLRGDGIQGWADEKDVRIVVHEEARTESETDAFPFRAKVTAEPSLNVRSGPGVEYETLSELPTGTAVTVIGGCDGWGELPDGGWIKLKYAERE